MSIKDIKMNKEEYIKLDKDIRNNLFEKYSNYCGYIIINIFNIRHIENVCEEVGLITKRKNYDNSIQFYSEVYDKEKLIGIISNQGTPTIMFLRRCRKYAKLIQNRTDVIQPIEGVHRILDWHIVKGKQHILHNNETILHFLPVNITDEDAIDFLTKTKLIDKIDDIKKEEEEMFKKLDN